METTTRPPLTLAEPIRTWVDGYMKLIQQEAGTVAKSLTLFGPIAAGRFDPARHTIQSVLVLTKVDLDLLRRLSAHGPKLGKSRISAPLIMTDRYIKASLDSFPLELIEIVQAHETLFGTDPFQELRFDDEHVRLQCERELKRILISLRQAVLASAGNDRALEALEQELLQSLIRTMRGLLWLNGDHEGRPAESVVTAIESRMEGSLPGIRNALNTTAQHDWETFKALYREVEGLAEAADV